MSKIIEAAIRADERERLIRAAIPLDAYVNSPDWLDGMSLETWIEKQGVEPSPHMEAARKRLHPCGPDPFNPFIPTHDQPTETEEQQ